MAQRRVAESRRHGTDHYEASIMPVMLAHDGVTEALPKASMDMNSTIIKPPKRLPATIVVCSNAFDAENTLLFEK